MAYKDDYLLHFGIKGQKWGVRRFQNEDGSLTDAGKARIAKAGYYKDPNLKGSGYKHAENRQEVIREYNKEWTNRREEMYDRPHKSSQANKELYDRFKDKYAAATLKDLGFKNTKKARRDVEGVLKDIDPDYDFDRKKNHDLSATQLTEYRERQHKLAHPTREKIKRGIAGIKNTVDFATKVKSLIKKG